LPVKGAFSFFSVRWTGMVVQREVTSRLSCNILQLAQMSECSGCLAGGWLWLSEKMPNLGFD
jgi:hypothetical protein